MWESTGVVETAQGGLLPFAVDSDRDAGEDLLTQPEAVRRARSLRVRFCPTKNWDDYKDPRKQTIVAYIAERILHGDLLHRP
jgi:hypothetical protein